MLSVTLAEHEGQMWQSLPYKDNLALHPTEEKKQPWHCYMSGNPSLYLEMHDYFNQPQFMCMMHMAETSSIKEASTRPE